MSQDPARPIAFPIVNVGCGSGAECDHMCIVCGLPGVRSPRICGGGTPLPNEGRISERVFRHDTRPTGDAAGLSASDHETGQSAVFVRPLRQTPDSFARQAVRRPLGRSHRAAVGKAKLKAAIEMTRDILGVPADYRIGIVPASDTGAVEMAMWSMLGARPCTMLAWESFGAGWVTDVVKQLKLDATVKTAEYGEIVDLARVDFDTDVVFTWNGTTSGVRLPNGDAIPADRAGLTICDATSAAFAQDLPWDKLDVTTFSWQKVMGGEAAHGMLILSPARWSGWKATPRPGPCRRSSA
jgi:hypothetical protein